MSFAPKIPTLDSIYGDAINAPADPMKLHVPKDMGEAQLLFGQMKRKSRKERAPELFRAYDPRRLQALMKPAPYLVAMFKTVLSRLRYARALNKVFLAYHPAFPGYLGAWQELETGRCECFSLFYTTPKKEQLPAALVGLPQFAHLKGLLGEPRMPKALDLELALDLWLRENDEVDVDNKLAATEEAKEKQADDDLDAATLDASEYYFDFLHRVDFNHGRRHKAVPTVEKEEEPMMREDRKNGYVVRTRIGSRFDVELAEAAIARAHRLNDGADRREREMAKTARDGAIGVRVVEARRKL